MPAEPDRLALRKTAKAWAVRKAKLHAAMMEASQKQAVALYDAMSAGIPMSTLAKDAGVDRSLVYKLVKRWCDRNEIPEPDLLDWRLNVPRFASEAEKREQEAAS